MRRRAMVLLLLAAMAAALVAASGVAWAAVIQCPASEFIICWGTEKSDVIRGTDGYNNIAARGGNDTVNGGGGYADDISGGEGNDTLRGGPGTDYLVGQAGNDKLYGYAGEDYIDAREHGGSGTGLDRVVSGGEGNDEIRANDGQVDHISCGGGTDVVYFDQGIDRVSSTCEDQRPTQTV